ncbi:hypothetical protein KVR01_000573 [Diaporthe batatas]|uniref:uncharacterized protein n=1 Tax=Diaporthe batatas TaxID=748121 RepID=UPI001D048E97|nr:uncharacterized protein KVR01_000573 [Diaporthe batatas]KAG8169828.1 hypothetical protein KVR01_000573 [Diaporthe batatas]
MATQIRDTAFGQLVRRLSNNRWLRYPDEVDPTLWEKHLRDREFTRDEKPNGTDASSPRPERSIAGDVTRSVEDGQDVFLVDWYGPDDPENPTNWPEAWKFLVAAQVCVLNFVVYIASSLYVPGETGFELEFGAGPTAAILGLSLFSVGYGLGPMLWSPMSEMPQLGRSGIYVWTLLGFVLLQLPTGLAVDAAMFLAFRAVSGFVGSPALATGGATITDVYGPARAAFGICIWASFGVCGPVFGPLIGGFVAPAKGWRWTIWIYTWMCAMCLILLFFLLPETSSATILYRRAKRLRRGTDRQCPPYDKDHLLVLSRAFTLTFTEPIVLVVDLYSALLYGVLFTWFESFPLVFGDIYRFEPEMQGLVYLGLLVTLMIVVPLYLLWVQRVLVPASSKPGFIPEHVLPPTWAGAVALPVCLFWYGWTARESIHWIVPIIGSSLFTIPLVTFFNGILNYLGMSYSAYAASVFAGNALFRALFGAIFPLFARSLFTNLGVGPGNSLLGGIAVLFLPINFILYFYGPRIRAMSRHARHDE